jgi:hypothetical protein
MVLRLYTSKHVRSDEVGKSSWGRNTARLPRAFSFKRSEPDTVKVSP